jgi:hypothetical protein
MGSINNAQANPMMVGFILAGLAALAQERWKWGVALIVAATFLKVYPVIFALLLLATYPRKTLGSLLMLVGMGLVVPFLFQSPGYVSHQYVKWIENLHADDRMAWDLSVSYRDLWLLIRRAELPISTEVYQLIQVGIGGIVAALCLLGRWKRLPTPALLNSVLSFGMCWIALCGPATESSTYIVLAPTISWILVSFSSTERSVWFKSSVLVSYGLLLSAWLAAIFPNAAIYHSWGSQPLAALILFVALGMQHWSACFSGSKTYISTQRTTIYFEPTRQAT